MTSIRSRNSTASRRREDSFFIASDTESTLTEALPSSDEDSLFHIDDLLEDGAHQRAVVESPGPDQTPAGPVTQTKPPAVEDDDDKELSFDDSRSDVPPPDSPSIGSRQVPAAEGSGGQSRRMSDASTRSDRSSSAALFQPPAAAVHVTQQQLVLEKSIVAARAAATAEARKSLVDRLSQDSFSVADSSSPSRTSAPPSRRITPQPTPSTAASASLRRPQTFIVTCRSILIQLHVLHRWTDFRFSLEEHTDTLPLLKYIVSTWLQQTSAGSQNPVGVALPALWIRRFCCGGVEQVLAFSSPQHVDELLRMVKLVSVHLTSQKTRSSGVASPPVLWEHLMKTVLEIGRCDRGLASLAACIDVASDAAVKVLEAATVDQTSTCAIRIETALSFLDLLQHASRLQHRSLTPRKQPTAIAYLVSRNIAAIVGLLWSQFWVNCSNDLLAATWLKSLNNILSALAHSIAPDALQGAIDSHEDDSSRIKDIATTLFFSANASAEHLSQMLEKLSRDHAGLIACIKQNTTVLAEIALDHLFAARDAEREILATYRVGNASTVKTASNPPKRHPFMAWLDLLVTVSPAVHSKGQGLVSPGECPLTQRIQASSEAQIAGSSVAPLNETFSFRGFEHEGGQVSQQLDETVSDYNDHQLQPHAATSDNALPMSSHALQGAGAAVLRYVAKIFVDREEDLKEWLSHELLETATSGSFDAGVSLISSALSEDVNLETRLLVVDILDRAVVAVFRDELLAAKHFTALGDVRLRILHSIGTSSDTRPLQRLIRLLQHLTNGDSGMLNWGSQDVWALLSPLRLLVQNAVDGVHNAATVERTDQLYTISTICATLRSIAAAVDGGWQSLLCPNKDGSRSLLQELLSLCCNAVICDDVAEMIIPLLREVDVSTDVSNVTLIGTTREKFGSLTPFLLSNVLQDQLHRAGKSAGKSLWDVIFDMLVRWISKDEDACRDEPTQEVIIRTLIAALLPVVALGDVSDGHIRRSRNHPSSPRTASSSSSAFASSDWQVDRTHFLRKLWSLIEFLVTKGTLHPTPTASLIRQALSQLTTPTSSMPSTTSGIHSEAAHTENSEEIQFLCAHFLTVVCSSINRSQFFGALFSTATSDSPLSRKPDRRSSINGSSTGSMPPPLTSWNISATYAPVDDSGSQGGAPNIISLSPVQRGAKSIVSQLLMLPAVSETISPRVAALVCFTLSTISLSEACAFDALQKDASGHSDAIFHTVIAGFSSSAEMTSISPREAAIIVELWDHIVAARREEKDTSTALLESKLEAAEVSLKVLKERYEAEVSSHEHTKCVLNKQSAYDALEDSSAKGGQGDVAVEEVTFARFVGIQMKDYADIVADEAHCRLTLVQAFFAPLPNQVKIQHFQSIEAIELETRLSICGDECIEFMDVCLAKHREVVIMTQTSTLAEALVSAVVDRTPRVTPSVVVETSQPPENISTSTQMDVADEEFDTAQHQKVSFGALLDEMTHLFLEVHLPGREAILSNEAHARGEISSAFFASTGALNLSHIQMDHAMALNSTRESHEESDSLLRASLVSGLLHSRDMCLQMMTQHATESVDSMIAVTRGLQTTSERALRSTITQEWQDAMSRFSLECNEWACKSILDLARVSGEMMMGDIDSILRMHKMSLDSISSRLLPSVHRQGCVTGLQASVALLSEMSSHVGNEFFHHYDEVVDEIQSHHRRLLADHKRLHTAELQRQSNTFRQQHQQLVEEHRSALLVAHNGTNEMKLKVEGLEETLRTVQAEAAAELEKVLQGSGLNALHQRNVELIKAMHKAKLEDVRREADTAVQTATKAVEKVKAAEDVHLGTIAQLRSQVQELTERVKIAEAHSTISHHSTDNAVARLRQVIESLKSALSDEKSARSNAETQHSVTIRSLSEQMQRDAARHAALIDQQQRNFETQLRQQQQDARIEAGERESKERVVLEQRAKEQAARAAVLDDRLKQLTQESAASEARLNSETDALRSDNRRLDRQLKERETVLAHQAAELKEIRATLVQERQNLVLQRESLQSSSVEWMLREKQLVEDLQRREASISDLQSLITKQSSELLAESQKKQLLLKRLALLEAEDRLMQKTRGLEAFDKAQGSSKWPSHHAAAQTDTFQADRAEAAELMDQLLAAQREYAEADQAHRSGLNSLNKNSLSRSDSPAGGAAQGSKRVDQIRNLAAKPFSIQGVKSLASRRVAWGGTVDETGGDRNVEQKTPTGETPAEEAADGSNHWRQFNPFKKPFDVPPLRDAREIQYDAAKDPHLNGFFSRRSRK